MSEMAENSGTAVGDRGPVQPLSGGVVCALVTPFDESGAPDRGALAALLEFQIQGGANGLFVMGTSGEGVLCSKDERKSLTEFILDEVAGRLPVVVHCGAVDTNTAADLARHAAAGASAVAATPPFFFAYTEAALYEHFCRLAEAAPSVDHYVYDNPERVGFSVGVPLVLRLVNDVEPIVGVKDTGDSLGKITQYLTRGAQSPKVYTGNNVIVLGALIMGAQGAVSALCNATPELFAQLYRAFLDGEIDKARELQLVAARLQAAVTGFPYFGAVKHLLRLRGLPGGRTRAPLPDLTEGQARELAGRVDADDYLKQWFVPVG